MWAVSLEALEGLTGRLLALGLIHAAWIGLMAAALAAIVLQTLPGLSRRRRHGLLISAFGAVAFGPLVAVAAQRESALSGTHDGEMSIRVAITRGDVAQPHSPAMADVNPELGPDLRPRIGPRRGRMLFLKMLTGLEAIQPFVVASWLTGVSLLSARLLLGAFSIRRLVRSARPAPGLIQACADDLARRLKLRRTPSVLVHPGLGEPCLCGIFRPRILLPGSWLSAADPARIDAILAHELAHARRLDLPVSLAQRLVETGLFFHPAVHWLSRSLRREREHCADALAVRLTCDPFSLASALESVARNRLSPSSCRRSPTFGASLGGEKYSLLPRIQELLGMTPTTPARRSIWPWLSLPVGISLALLGASLGLAQDPPKPAPISQPTAAKVPTANRPAPAVRVLPDPAGSDDQISYEVRFLSVAEPAWREKAKDRMQEVHREGGVIAWIVRDPKSTRDLLTSLLSDPKSKILQAPKVTSFENARATISPEPKQNLIAEFQKLKAMQAKGFIPINWSIEMGSQVDLSGIIRPGSVLMTVDLFDTSLNAVDQLKELRDVKSYVYTSHLRLSKDVPEGASLLISQGRQEVPPENPPAKVQPAGNAVSITRERLVLITPWRILLESEEMPCVQDPKSPTGVGQASPERSLRYFNFSMSAMY